jgi:polyhydroxyalkanoate synthesis regulator phasin
MMKKSVLRQIIGEEISLLKENEYEKKKLVDCLSKKGFNPKDAKNMVEKHYDYVMRVYKNQGLTIAKIANIISSL